MNPPLELEGHVSVTALAGTASLTVHRHVGPLCLPFLTMVLADTEIRAMHAELSKALTATRPLIRVRQDRRTGLWLIDCPLHADLPGRWTNQPAAMAATRNHLHYAHQEQP